MVISEPQAHPASLRTTCCTVALAGLFLPYVPQGGHGRAHSLSACPPLPGVLGQLGSASLLLSRRLDQKTFTRLPLRWNFPPTIKLLRFGFSLLQSEFPALQGTPITEAESLPLIF